MIKLQLCVCVCVHVCVCVSRLSTSISQEVGDFVVGVLCPEFLRTKLPHEQQVTFLGYLIEQVTQFSSSSGLTTISMPNGGRSRERAKRIPCL